MLSNEKLQDFLTIFHPIQKNIIKLRTFQNYGLPEFIALFCLIYIIFVMLKHLLFHTGYYYFHRTGRKLIAFYINSLKNTTTTERIFKFSNFSKLNSIKNIENSIRKFCKNHFYEHIPSLLDNRKELAFLNEIFKSKRQVSKILLFLDDNLGQELFLILAKISNSDFTENVISKIDVVFQAENANKHLIIEKIVKRTLNIVNFKTNLPVNLEINFLNKDKLRIKKNTYDLIYFGDASIHVVENLKFCISNGLAEKKLTVFLANHALNGGETMVDYLMLVRRDKKRYETSFLIGNLESTPVPDKQLLDGIEKVVYLGE